MNYMKDSLFRYHESNLPDIGHFSNIISIFCRHAFGCIELFAGCKIVSNFL